MTQLILDVARHRHGVRNLFAQQLAVALTKPMERLLHRVFSHPQFTSDLRLEKMVRFICKQFLESVEQLRITRRSVLFAKPCEHLLKYRQRPASFVNSISA